MLCACKFHVNTFTAANCFHSASENVSEKHEVIKLIISYKNEACVLTNSFINTFTNSFKNMFLNAYYFGEHKYSRRRASLICGRSLVCMSLFHHYLTSKRL